MSAAWTAFIFIAAEGALPTNAMDDRLSARDKSNILRLLPEGWSFFTRDPREADPEPFIREPGGGWRRVLQRGRGGIVGLLGLDRASRGQGVEMGLLTGPVPRHRWTRCDRGAWSSCLSAAPVLAEVVNPSPQPTLCGNVAIVFRRPVPWAWARSVNLDQMPAEIVRLRVSC
jgi:antimicrobial peptide system SdpA family protein